MTITENKYPVGSTELIDIIHIAGSMGGGLFQGVVFPDPLLKGVPSTATDRIKQAVKRTYGEPFIATGDFTTAGLYPNGDAHWLDPFNRNEAAKYIVQVNGLFIYSLEELVVKKPQDIIDKTAQYYDLFNKPSRTATEEETLINLDHDLESYYSKCV